MMLGWRQALLPLLGSAFLLSACPVRAAMVQPEVVESGSLIVTAETAKVRGGPSLGAEVVTVIGKGEIFLKQGRTGGWYYVKINDDTFGWISGRDVISYQTEGTASPSVVPESEPVPFVGPYDDRYYPYYPGGYYDYSYYWWGEPYLSWEWYYYGREPYRYRTWDYKSDYQRYPARERSLVDDGRSRDGRWKSGNDSHRSGVVGPRSSTPRIRGPFRRR